ncbi:MAG: hypothetical protein VB674_03675 [Vicinamibacterales bacterium]
MYHPAGFRHYDGAKDADVVVQIMGMGPVETIRTEIGSGGKPVPRQTFPVKYSQEFHSVRIGKFSCFVMHPAVLQD